MFGIFGCSRCNSTLKPQELTVLDGRQKLEIFEGWSFRKHLDITKMEKEIKAIAKTRQIGGSLVVTIPASVVKTEQLEEDQWVEIKINKHRRDYFGALKGIGRFTKEDRAKGQLDDE